MTLHEWAIRLPGIYGKNNAVYLTSLHEKLGLLIVTLRTLQDLVRKKKSKRRLARALAHTFAWHFAVVDHLHYISLTYYMCLKYPSAGCSYCQKKPCRCLPEDREKHKHKRVDPAQYRWSVADWQRHLNSLYGQANKGRGVEETIVRIFAEVAEIHHILAGTFIGQSANDILDQYGMEIADVAAWIFALANILEIDLSEAMDGLYKNGCPCCHSNPCSCKKFVISGGKIRHVPELFPVP